MFIDTHTHLFTKEFDEDRIEVIQRAIDRGVELMLLPNIDIDTIDSMNGLVKQFPKNCMAMMGLHPGSVKENWEERLEKIGIELFSGSYIAVGEIGMDLYWDTTFFKEQQKVFRKQVQWAKELKLPIVIHAREAFDEIFEILDQENEDTLTGVFHCFTGSEEQARKVLDYGGFKIGLGGVLTYKKANLEESLKNVPLESIVLETDSPYLAPVPNRGKRNESAYLLHVAEKLADIYNVTLATVESTTTASAKELFRLN